MSGSMRGVKFFYKAKYCGTPQSKERRNGEYKVCLNEGALRLLDWFTTENGAILGASLCGLVRFWLAGGSGSIRAEVAVPQTLFR